MEDWSCPSVSQRVSQSDTHIEAAQLRHVKVTYPITQPTGLNYLKEKMERNRFERHELRSK